MSGNGQMADVLVRLEGAETDARDLRQLFMDELRATRVEMKAIADGVRALAEQVRLTGQAVDTLLAELRLRDLEEQDRA